MRQPRFRSRHHTLLPKTSLRYSDAPHSMHARCLSESGFMTDQTKTGDPSKGTFQGKISGRPGRQLYPRDSTIMTGFISGSSQARHGVQHKDSWHIRDNCRHGGGSCQSGLVFLKNYAACRFWICHDGTSAPSRLFHAGIHTCHQAGSTHAIRRDPHMPSGGIHMPSGGIHTCHQAGSTHAIRRDPHMPSGGILCLLLGNDYGRLAYAHNNYKIKQYSS